MSLRLERSGDQTTWRTVYIPVPRQGMGVPAGGAIDGLAAAWRWPAAWLRQLALPSTAVRVGAVVAVLAVAVALRVLELDRLGLNSDEAVYSGQAGALIGDSSLSEFFSVFRAHPLVLQSMLGGIFTIFGVNDLAARLFVSLTFGVGSVVFTYLLGRSLYGHWTGVVGAALMAAMPYHVLVSRQVLVDGPLAFFVVVTFWFMAKAKDDHSGFWIIGAALAAGLATGSKEVGVLLLPVIGAFLLITRHWRQIPFLRLAISLAIFGALVLPYPLSRLLFAPSNGGAYFLWQLTRPPNHEATYFLQVLGEFGGIIFLGLALLGMGRMISRLRSDSDVLILLWIAVFFGFFQIFPTKLFFYLIVVIPPLAISAAVGFEVLTGWLAGALRGLKEARWPVARAVTATAVVALTIYLGMNSLSIIRGESDAIASPIRFDIEVQDFAGGREFGLWAKDNTPADARFLTIGPSMGNILRFYGLRDSVGLSVSPDPARRNPAYVPVPNPDDWFRRLGLHYIVWDFYSADRSAFYNDRLMRFARRHGGALVFAVYQEPNGDLIVSMEPPEGAEPRILVWDAIGGSPLEISSASTNPGPAPADPAGPTGQEDPESFIGSAQ